MQFSCIAPNTQFYLYLVLIIASLDILYILASLYCLLWLTITDMRKLSRLLHRYRVGVENYSDKNNWDEAKKGASIDVENTIDFSSLNSYQKAKLRCADKFKCDLCGKGFPLGCLLQRHKRTHLDSKPHSCHYCDKVQFMHTSYWIENMFWTQ